MICNNQTTPSQQKKVYLCSIIAYISELQASVKDSATLTVTTGKRRLCNRTSKRTLTGQFFNNLTQTNEPTLKSDPTVFKIFAHPHF